MTQNAQSQSQDFHPRNRHERRHPPKMTAIPKLPLTNSQPESENVTPKLPPFDQTSTPSEADVMNMIAAMSTQNGDKTNLPPALPTSGLEKSADKKPRADKFDALEKELSAWLSSITGPMMLIPALQGDALIILSRAPGLIHSHVEVARVYPEYYKALKALVSGSVIATCAVETITLILMIAVAHGFKVPGLDKLLQPPQKPVQKATLDLSAAVPTNGHLPVEDVLQRTARETVFSNWRAMNEADNGMDVPGVS